MKKFLCKTLSLFLVFSLLCSLGLTAAASDALGDDLTARDTLLNRETELSTNVFWSSSYSDLRTENLVTYTPNRDVTPLVTFGGSLTARTTVTAAARELEAQGYRVVAGINGDFFNTSNGLPIGILVSDGKLLSSDAGYYAIGFREDGSAVIGKPGLSVTADLGYQLADSSGYASEVIRTVTGVNKARVSTGGIYLYTYEFNDRHTTGNTEAGVDVICTVTDGSLAIGSTLTAVVEQVTETAGTATAIGPDQIVLSANALSSAYHTDALRNIPAGTEITLTITAADEDWNDVVYASGALYSLVEDGSVVSGLPSGQNPRTAVGVKRDGTVIFYTIDGRRSGHSIGATLSQVAQRLIELGCVAAVGLDGGGSTTLTVTQPDDTAVSTVNRPSDGSERKVTNHLFLVADSEPSGRLDHFYVQADYDYVLAGSRVEISAAAVDTNFIPMDGDYRLDASAGELDGSILTTPARGGDITVTASHGRQEGSTVVHAIADPTDLAIRNASGTALTSLETTLGAVTALTATAAWNHISLKADAEAFTWEVDGKIGTIDEKGNFTATAPGSGTITVSAGRTELSIPVTVSGTVSSGGVMAVEDFEGSTTIFRGSGSSMDFSLNHTADTVRMGRGSARVDYTLTETGASQGAYTAEWRASRTTSIDTGAYTALHMWVYGDGSGNQLSLLCGSDDGSVPTPVTLLDFTGWKQVTVSLPSGSFGPGRQPVRERDPALCRQRIHRGLRPDGGEGPVFRGHHQRLRRLRWEAVLQPRRQPDPGPGGRHDRPHPGKGLRHRGADLLRRVCHPRLRRLLHPDHGGPGGPQRLRRRHLPPRRQHHPGPDGQDPLQSHVMPERRTLSGPAFFSAPRGGSVREPEPLPRPLHWNGALPELRAGVQEPLREGVVSPLVHGQKAADVRRLQKIPRSPEAVLSQPGVQRQHGQVDPPAPEWLRVPLEIDLHVPVPGGVLSLPMPPVQIPGVEDRPSVGADQKGRALVGGGQRLHRDAGQGRRALAAGEDPAFCGSPVGEAPSGPVPVCQADPVSQQEADLPPPVVQGEDPGGEVVRVAMAGKHQERLVGKRRQLSPPPVKQQRGRRQLRQKAAVVQKGDGHHSALLLYTLRIGGEDPAGLTFSKTPCPHDTVSPCPWQGRDGYFPGRRHTVRSSAALAAEFFCPQCNKTGPDRVIWMRRHGPRRPAS